MGAAQDCSSLIYGPDGTVDFTKTLFNCSDQMSDPELIYSYKEMTDPVTVYTQVNLNNLVTVSELESTMVLDLFFILSWADPRWVLNDLFEGQKAALSYQGLAVDQLVFATDETRLRIWLPDITFTDEIGQVMVAQTLKLRPNGFFLWTRHLRLDIVQPHFTYEDFPLDIQQLNIRFMSNSYSIDFLRLQYSEQAVSFVKAAYPNLDDLNWELNNQWILNSDDYKAFVWEDTRNFSAGASTISTTYDSAILILDAERISDGMLIRLGVPILILMVLSGLVFWAAAENRIDATMTILLAVSALYIVVFGSIPMLGYLTAFDTYIISMFFLLTCAVAVHQLNYRISEKADRRPLRFVFVRFFEFLGRVSLFPVAIIMFVVMFPSHFVLTIKTPFLVLLSIVIFIVAVRDIGGVRKTFLNAMAYYGKRRDKDEMHTMSEFELKFFLFYEKNLKRWCVGKKKAEIDEDEDEEDDEDESDVKYVPRMMDPNRSGNYNKSNSIYVAENPNSSFPRKSSTINSSAISSINVNSSVPDSSGSTGSADGTMPNGVQLNDISNGVEQIMPKRVSEKKQKKQAIINNIKRAQKLRAAKRQSQEEKTNVDSTLFSENPMNNTK